MTATDDSYDLVVHADAAFVDGVFRPATIGVRGGAVAAIEPGGALLDGREVVTLSPGEVLSRASSTPTCTSTSPAAPSGRASPRRPGPRPRAA